MKTIRLGMTGLMLILSVSAVLAQSAGPEIKADNPRESREIRDGAADVNKPGATRMNNGSGGGTVQGGQQSSAAKGTSDSAK